MDLQFLEIFRIVIICMDLLLDLTRFPLAVQTYLPCLNLVAKLSLSLMIIHLKNYFHLQVKNVLTLCLSLHLA